MCIPGNFLQRIQEEIVNREKKFAYLDEAALYLIQKGDSADAISVQAELDTFKQYHRQVMDRMTMTKAKLEVQQVRDLLYCECPKNLYTSLSDKSVYADPDQTTPEESLIRVYTVYHYTKYFVKQMHKNA